MAARVFVTRGLTVALSYHLDVQKEGPLARAANVRGVLQDVPAQESLRVDLPPVERDRPVARQLKLCEDAQGTHDLRPPSPAHVNHTDAFAEETRQRVRLRVRHVI